MGTEPPAVRALGEFGLIDALTARMPQGPDVLLGPGDDAAVVAAADGRVVASTDVLVQGVHFRTDWSSATDVGHKAAAANLADIVAMGARPTALLLGLAVPPDLPAQWALDLAEGLAAEAATAGACVVGGDVVSAASIVVAVTALGDLQGRAALTRSGARPGDVLAHCGRLGQSAAGLALLTAGQARAHPRIVTAHRRPVPPYAAGVEAAELGATSLIDVSDGLLADAGHVAVASGVAIDIAARALRPGPELAAAAASLEVDPVALMLTGGEDHGLIATFGPDVAVPASWTVLGRVSAGAGVTVDGSTWTGIDGWRHF